MRENFSLELIQIGHRKKPFFQIYTVGSMRSLAFSDSENTVITQQKFPPLTHFFKNFLFKALLAKKVFFCRYGSCV